jgi:hypothetical protein
MINLKEYQIFFVGNGSFGNIFKLNKNNESIIMKVYKTYKSFIIEKNWYELIYNYNNKHLSIPDYIGSDTFDIKYLNELLPEKINTLEKNIYVIYISKVDDTLDNYLKNGNKLTPLILFSYLYNDFTLAKIYGLCFIDNKLNNLGLIKINKPVAFHIKYLNNEKIFVFQNNEKLPQYLYQRFDLDLEFLDQDRENIWVDYSPIYEDNNLSESEIKKRKINAKYDRTTINPYKTYKTKLSNDEKIKLNNLNEKKNDQILFKYKLNSIFNPLNYDVRSLYEKNKIQNNHFLNINDFKNNNIIENDLDKNTFNDIVELLNGLLENNIEITTNNFYKYISTYFFDYEINMDYINKDLGDPNNWIHFYAYIDNDDNIKNLINTNINVKIFKNITFYNIDELLLNIKKSLNVLIEIQNDNIIKHNNNNNILELSYINKLKLKKWDGVEGLLQKGIFNNYINTWNIFKNYYLNDDNYNIDAHIEKYAPRLNNDDKIILKTYYNELIYQLNELKKNGIFYDKNKMILYSNIDIDNNNINFDIIGMGIVLNDFIFYELNKLYNKILLKDDSDIPIILIGIISLLKNKKSAPKINYDINKGKPIYYIKNIKLYKNKEIFIDNKYLIEYEESIKNNWDGVEGLLSFGIMDPYINIWHIIRNYYIAFTYDIIDLPFGMKSYGYHSKKQTFDIYFHLQKYFDSKYELYYIDLFNYFINQIKIFEKDGFVIDSNYGISRNETSIILKPNETIKNIYGIGIPFNNINFNELKNICNLVCNNGDILIGFISLFKHDSNSKLFIKKTDKIKILNDIDIFNKYEIINESNEIITFLDCQEIYINWNYIK